MVAQFMAHDHIMVSGWKQITRQDAGPTYSSQDPPCSYPPARSHSQEFAQSPTTAPPVEDQVFKHVSHNTHNYKLS